MKHAISHKLRYLGFSVIVSAVVFVGCTGAEKSAASIDNENASIKVYQSASETCNDAGSVRAMNDSGGPKGIAAARAMNDSGGPKGAPRMTALTTCGGVVFEATGTCLDCQSVQFQIGDTSFSWDVASDGTFKAVVSLSSINGDVTMTPVDASGVEGIPLTISASSIEVSQLPLQ